MALQFLFMPMVMATFFLVYNISLSNQILNLGEKIAYYQNEENTTKIKIEKFEELLENERKRHANDIRLFYIRFLHYINFSQSKKQNYLSSILAVNDQFNLEKHLNWHFSISKILPNSKQMNYILVLTGMQLG